MPPFGPHVKGFILTFLRILIDADFPFPAEDSNAYDQIMNLRYLAVAGSVNNIRTDDIFFTTNICAFTEKKWKQCVKCTWSSRYTVKSVIPSTNLSTPTHKEKSQIIYHRKSEKLHHIFNLVTKCTRGGATVVVKFSLPLQTSEKMTLLTYQSPVISVNWNQAFSLSFFCLWFWGEGPLTRVLDSRSI